MSIPKAFISYSHDSQEHKKWVLDFATRLRNSGIDAILDQWELKAGDDLPHFMEKHLVSADRVLMVCTDRYVEKANTGSGGVGYEKMIVTADLLKTIDSNKVIPIIRQSGSHLVPTFLKSKLFLDFSRDDQLEFAFDELIRTLQNAPLFVKPPIGNNPFEPVAGSEPQRSGDGLIELMKAVGRDYNSHTGSYSRWVHVLKGLGISRVMFDLLVDEAIAERLLRRLSSTNSDLILTDKGKAFIVRHTLDKEE